MNEHCVKISTTSYYLYVLMHVLKIQVLLAIYLIHYMKHNVLKMNIVIVSPSVVVLTRQTLKPKLR